ncbi:hypothetical protein SEA_CHARM_60 [Mycobacterium phage Charm]|nr:hypothetical protein SEA_CHARM_60 [Mycobacterium phage Charm]QGJ88339.1 hypothetical protein SEA_DREAMTEAM1_60 [Mycobacterium phage DreamTeam1]
MTLIRPKYYRIDVVVRAQVAEDTDALSTYIENRLKEVFLEPVSDPDVYEVTHFE